MGNKKNKLWSFFTGIANSVWGWISSRWKRNSSTSQSNASPRADLRPALEIESKAKPLPHTSTHLTSANPVFIIPTIKPVLSWFSSKFNLLNLIWKQNSRSRALLLPYFPRKLRSIRPSVTEESKNGNAHPPVKQKQTKQPESTGSDKKAAPLSSPTSTYTAPTYRLLEKNETSPNDFESSTAETIKKITDHVVHQLVTTMLFQAAFPFVVPAASILKNIGVVARITSLDLSPSIDPEPYINDITSAVTNRIAKLIMPTTEDGVLAEVSARLYSYLTSNPEIVKALKAIDDTLFPPVPDTGVVTKIGESIAERAIAEILSSVLSVVPVSVSLIMGGYVFDRLKKVYSSLTESSDNLSETFLTEASDNLSEAFSPDGCGQGFEFIDASDAQPLSYTQEPSISFGANQQPTMFANTRSGSSMDHQTSPINFPQTQQRRRY